MHQEDLAKACVITELARALAERRLIWTPDQMTLLRQAIRNGCVPNPQARPEAQARYEAILRAHAGMTSEPTSKRQSAAGRRQAIIAVLQADPGMSDRAVGRRLHVDGKTVANVRASLGLRNPHLDSAGQDRGNTTG
jgi:hypothetical protein